MWATQCYQKKGKKNDGLNEKEHDSKTKSKINCAMIIEILNDTILHGLPMTSKSEHTLQYITDTNVKNITFKYIISKYKLDFKQAVAFEIMRCSFILKSLKKNKILLKIYYNSSLWNTRTTRIKTLIV